MITTYVTFIIIYKWHLEVSDINLIVWDMYVYY